MVKRFFHLYRKRRFSPYEIHFNDLLNPRISDEALDYYMSKEEMLAFDDQHILDTYLCVTADKSVFYSLCAAAGVPIPRLLAVFDLPAGWTPEGRLLRSRSEWCAYLQTLPQDFIVKPALGLQGKGVNAFHRESNEFVDHQGGRRTEGELYDLLCRVRDLNLFSSGYSHRSLKLSQGSHKAIIQERLATHPELLELTGSPTLCTCRLLTSSDRVGNVEILGSAFRVVGGSAIVDNFDQGIGGNMWCSVDAHTGQIREAFARPSGSNRLEPTSKHPVTGRAVIGFRIPDWSRAVEMAQRLETIFRPQTLITWDIGLSRCGPVAIEGNISGGLLPSPMNRPVAAMFTEQRR